MFPDSLSQAQFGLTVSDLEQQVSSESSLSLMGVSGGVSQNVLQPVILSHTEGGEELGSRTSHQQGDKSPLPELTQLSSNSFRGEQQTSQSLVGLFGFYYQVKP